MALELTTVGAKVAYAVETTAGTRPTTNFIDLEGMTEAPELGLSTSTLDCSDLSDKITRYVNGRQDPGGEKAFKANNTPAFRQRWAECVSAYETAKASGKQMYFAYIVEGDTDAFYWKGIPVPLGSDGLAGNSIYTCSPKVICTGVDGYETAPTLKNVSEG